MSAVQLLQNARLSTTSPRFSAVKPQYKQHYREFITQKVMIDPLNTNAFLFIDLLRQNEPVEKDKTSGRRRRLALHDQLSLYLTKGEFQSVFRGIDTFVKELRQLLVAAGKIPKFISWIPFKGKPYRLDAEHKTMSREEAKDRLDSMRAVIVELTKKRKLSQLEGKADANS